MRRLFDRMRMRWTLPTDHPKASSRQIIGVETLEVRQLLTITQFPYPPSAASGSIAVGSDHDLWFTANDANKVDRLDPTTGVVTQYSPPDPLNPTSTLGQVSSEILAGPDGNLYFVFIGAGAPGSRFANADEYIDRLDPATGAITPLTIPASITNLTLGLYDTVGADGNLYFASGGNLLLKLAPSTGAMSVITVPDKTVDGASIAVGSDGTIDMAYAVLGVGTYYFATLNPSTGAFAKYLTPDKTDPTGAIVQAPDGNVYFTEYGDRLSGYLTKIDEFNTSTRAISQYTVNTTGSASAEFDFGDIIVGPDGNLYFSDSIGEAIGELNLSTKAVTETPMPSSVMGPDGLTIGPDNNLWFSEDGIGASNIGQMTVDSQGISPPAPPAPVTPEISGESVVIVKKQVVGFQLDFNEGVNAGAASSYSMTEFFKQRKKIIGKPVILKAANYNASTHTVQLIFKGKHPFALGGQISVNSSEITAANGEVLQGSTSFNIAKKAKGVSQ